jgi:hypothetical protein
MAVRMPDIEIYTYKSLNYRDLEIRLVELLPGADCQIIKCNIENFSPSQRPSYIALLYI